MALGATAILAAVKTHAQVTGKFEQIITHEPKSAPSTDGLTAAIWVDSIIPVPSSGLTATSARLTLKIRIYTNMLAEPEDTIDERILTAVDALMTEYSGDFELGGLGRNVDLFGTYGDPLSADAGYFQQDGHMYRVMVITLPLIINDLWTQAP